MGRAFGSGFSSAFGGSDAITPTGIGDGTLPRLTGTATAVFVSEVRVTQVNALVLHQGDDLAVRVTQAFAAVLHQGDDTAVRVTQAQAAVLHQGDDKAVRVTQVSASVLTTIAENVTKWRDDKHPSITPDTGGRCVFATAAGSATAIATNPITSDLTYWEFDIAALPSGTITVGLAPQNFNLNNEVGSNSLSAGLRTTGDVFTGNTATASGLGAIVAGERILIAFAKATGKVWFGKRTAAGVVTIIGDPVAGTGQLATLNTNKVYYPTLTFSVSGQRVCLATQYGDFLATPPAGYAPQDPTAATGAGRLKRLTGTATATYTPADLPITTGTGAGFIGHPLVDYRTVADGSVRTTSAGSRSTSGTRSRALVGSGSATSGLAADTATGSGALPRLTGAGSATSGLAADEGSGAGALPRLTGSGEARHAKDGGGGISTSLFALPQDLKEIWPTYEPPKPRIASGSGALRPLGATARARHGRSSFASGCIASLSGAASARHFDAVSADNELLLMMGL